MVKNLFNFLTEDRINVFIARFFIGILGLITYILYTKLLGANIYGAMVFLLAFIGLLFPFSTFSSQELVTKKFVIGDKEAGILDPEFP